MNGPIVHIMSVYPERLGVFPSHMKYKTGKSEVEPLFLTRLTRSSSEIHMIKSAPGRDVLPQKPVIHTHVPPVLSTACSAWCIN